ncbi:MAG: SBBP repeat-containing protein [Deltaproteobacteria bacterium]|nr:SBBP repeat-containing protein [Deltaproteobacteria bacterium]
MPTSSLASQPDTPSPELLGENTSKKLIEILTPIRHPMKGDHWNIAFKTFGKGHLTVIPQNTATINDIVYTQLTCGQNTVKPTKLLHRALLFRNWECDQIAVFSSLIKTVGNHRLVFRFLNQDAFASNAPFSWRSGKRLGGTGADYGTGIASDYNNNIIFIGSMTGNVDVNGDGDTTDGGAESSTGFAIEDGIVSFFNSAGTWLWGKRIGTAHATNVDRLYGLAVDSSGQIAIGGYFAGGAAADFNGDGDKTDGTLETSYKGGTSDNILTVFNSAGTWQWGKRIGSGGSDLATGLAIGPNNNIVISGTVYGTSDLNGDGDNLDGVEETAEYGSNDGFISVFDSSGNFQWAKRFGGTNASDRTQKVWVDSNNNVIALSYLYGTVDVNGDGDSADGGAESSSATYGLEDIFISFFNSAGTFQWAKRLGGTGTDIGRGLATDSNNNIIVAASVTGNADLNGDGDSTDGGAESSTGYGGTDSIITVFNSSGTWQWAKRFGNAAADYANNPVVDSANNIIVSAAITGNGDVNGDGDATDGGAESSTGYGLADAIVTIFTSSGTWKAAERYGGTDADSSTVGIDQANNMLLVGYVTGNADINADGDTTDGGAESSTGYGGTDAYLSIFEGYASGGLILIE